MIKDSLQRPWLVTGAAGFLGSHVVEEIIGQGQRVIALDNLSWGKLDHINHLFGNPNFHFITADIREIETVSRIFAEFQPARVIHLAALHYIPAAVADPALTVSINVYGTQTILSAALKANVESFWFASTGDVYAPSEKPHNEDDSLSPFNIYGLTKLQGEQLVSLAARNNTQVSFVIGRVFNLYGPRETNPHIIPEILKQLHEHPNEPLRLGNLWPKRELISITEAARAIVELVDKAPKGVTTVNIATGKAHSIQEVITVLGELLGGPISVETDIQKVRPVERDHLQADVTLLKNLLGWTPSDDLQTGLAALLKTEGFIVQG